MGTGRGPPERRPEEAANPGVPESRRRRRLTRVGGLLLKTLLPVVILVGAGIAYGYLRSTKPEVETKSVTEREWLVGTVTANKTTVTPELVLYGTIVAGREVELRPLVQGRVIEVGRNFAEGGLVRKDETLVVIDPFEYRAAVKERKAQLAEARSRLQELTNERAAEKAMLQFDEKQIDVRRRELQRRRDLLTRRTGTEKSVDDALLTLTEQQQRNAERAKRIESLDSKIAQQETIVSRAEVALDRAERDLRDTVLQAPFESILGEISIAIGKRVSVGDKIARLTDAGRLEAEFQITDSQYGRLVSEGSVIGKKVSVIWKAAEKPFEFPATIRRVSGRVASDSGGINLFARLDKTGLDTVLRPGVFVEVHLDDKPYEGVVRLPEEAVQSRDTVYVVEGDRLAARKVSIVGRVGNDVLVRGGLRTGDAVVDRIFPEIGPGIRVRVP